MTEIQKKMQELISKEDRIMHLLQDFRKKCRRNYEMPEQQLRGLEGLDPILQSCLQEVGSGNFCWWILMW